MCRICLGADQMERCAHNRWTSLIVLFPAMDSMGTWPKRSRRAEMRRMLWSSDSCCPSTTGTKADWPRTSSTDPDLQSLVSAPFPFSPPLILYSVWAALRTLAAGPDIYRHGNIWRNKSGCEEHCGDADLCYRRHDGTFHRSSTNWKYGVKNTPEPVWIKWGFKYLCPGFSILSGVEIIFFLLKFLIGIFTGNGKKKSRTKFWPFLPFKVNCLIRCIFMM